MNVPSPGKIRTVIFAAAPAARALETLLREEPAIEIVEQGLPADLVFLDARTAESPGWRLLDALARAPAPEAILILGRDPLAARACATSDVDYLLEPLTRRNLRTVVRRAEHRAAEETAESRAHRFRRFLGDLRKTPAYAERLAIRTRGARAVLRVDEIDWIEAAANYVRVHASGEAHVLRRTMSALESNLDPRRFARIHRCRIVNVDRIREFRPVPNGRSAIILQDGTCLEVSREQSRRLPALLGPR
jgi:two-component system LytT family response regulator